MIAWGAVVVAVTGFDAGTSGRDTAGRAISIDNASAVSAVRPAAPIDGFSDFAPDTLSFQVGVGDMFITVLPDSVGGQAVASFADVRIPARSWRRGRAFFWQTVAGDDGSHFIQFSAGTRTGPDTLTLWMIVAQ